MYMLSIYSFFSVEASVCGDFIKTDNVTTGELSSPDYPSHYPNNSVCIWLIEAPESQFVQFTLSFLQGEGTGSTCQDYIEVMSLIYHYLY